MISYRSDGGIDLARTTEANRGRESSLRPLAYLHMEHARKSFEREALDSPIS